MSERQEAGTQPAHRLSGLLERARKLGACDWWWPTAAALCAAPRRCPSYGLAPGCPPPQPAAGEFRAELADYRWVLVFRIDVPAADLGTGKRLEVAGASTSWPPPWKPGRTGSALPAPAGWPRSSCFELYCADQGRCAGSLITCPARTRVGCDPPCPRWALISPP